MEAHLCRLFNEQYNAVPEPLTNQYPDSLLLTQEEPRAAASDHFLSDG